MKLFKKSGGVVISLALAVIMMLPAVVQAADEIPKITLSVGKGQSSPEYKAEASDQALELNVENQGSADAKNVKVTPVIEDASAWPFEID